jgi:PIN domain nuclease of toxin-antitoxin system
VILLDAYALVALIAEEAAAAEVDEILRSEQAAISAINLAEVIDHLVRVRGAAIDEVRRALAPLIGSVVAPLAPRASDAWTAALIRAEHYGRRRAALSLADCFLIAAVGEEDAVATADPAVAETARALGRRVVALPDRAGVRP